MIFKKRINHLKAGGDVYPSGSDMWSSGVVLWG